MAGGRSPTPRRPSRVRRPAGGARRLAALATLAVLLVACDGDPAPEPDPPPDDDAQQAPDEAVDGARDGVSDEACPDAVDEELGCIYLGSLRDRSDATASDASEQQLRGQRDFWRRVNEDGGVDGHEVHVGDHVRDVTDDAEDQLDALDSIVDEVLALALLPGEATDERLVDGLREQRLVGVLPAWWSGWHAGDHRGTLLLPAEHSYCIGAVAGLDWYAQAAGRPASVLAIAGGGRAAEDLEGGGRLWAEQADAEWLGLTETSDDGDEPHAAVQAVLERAPDVVLLATPPAETGEIVRRAAAQGFEGTFLGMVGSWDPRLPEDAERAQSLQALYRHVGPWDEITPDVVAHAAMRDARDEDAPAGPSYLDGWLSSYPLLAALQAAAQGDGLTRDGLRAALDDLEVDPEGARPASRLGEVPEDPRIVVSVPDAGTTWGLRTDGVVTGGEVTDQLDHPADCVLG